MKKVLIVDDETEFCALVKETLELRGGYEVRMAYNGKEGVQLAKKFKPDVMLLDLRMPFVDGFSALDRLKKDTATIDIPVITLSALDDEESKVRCAQLYNDQYLTKPIKLEELQKKIEEVIARRSVK